jgi:hypothetical protein
MICTNNFKNVNLVFLILDFNNIYLQPHLDSYKLFVADLLTTIAVQIYSQPHTAFNDPMQLVERAGQSATDHKNESHQSRMDHKIESPFDRRSTWTNAVASNVKNNENNYIESQIFRFKSNKT